MKVLIKQVPGERHHTPASLDQGNVAGLFDLFVNHENAVSDLLATITPAVIERLEQIEAIAPGYRNAELCNLRPDAVDRLMRPLFEAAGIEDDFIPWRQRFPDYEREPQPERA